MARLRTLLFIMLMPFILNGADMPVCDKCTASKAFMRCAYYVGEKGDRTHQHACLLYARTLLEGESPGRASWYFILGGDFDQAIAAAKEALTRGEYFAYESLGEAYLLKGMQQEAKAAFAKLTTLPGYETFIQAHLQTLQKLYPQKDPQKQIRTLLTR